MGESFKARLKAGHKAIGVWIDSFDPVAAEILAGAGYDCAMVDMEHGPGSFRDAQTVLQAMRGSPCQPLIRVPSNDRVAVKRALDIGAAGVMCPSVSTVEEAREAAAACRYAPVGVRGMAATIVRASDYGRDWQAYVPRSDAEVLTICQIETRAGVDNVEAIAAVEGVDLLFIGPMDLSADLGFLGQPDHPEVQAAIGRVERAVKAAGKLLGTIPTPGRPARGLLAGDYDMILPDADTILLREGARASLAALRG